MAYHILRADNLLTARSPLRSPEKYRATLKISAFMIHEIFSNRARMVYTHHMTKYNGILVSERRWSAHQCWWALEWLKSPILEWQSLLQLEQM